MGQGASKFDHYGPLREDSVDIPIDMIPGLRKGYIATGLLAILSFVSCLLLFLFITVRLVQWHLTGGRPNRKDSPTTIRHEPSLDFDELTAPDPVKGGFRSHGAPAEGSIFSTKRQEQQANVPNIRQRAGHINPLLVFIYMLLAADVLQSGSMILNLVWLRQGFITSKSDTCRAQGWLRSHGDVACGMFAACISIYTYLTVVKGRWTGFKPVIAVASFIWVFSILIVGAGVWYTNDGAGAGGYWSRVATWCWISNEYPIVRMWTHFAWVLSSLAIVVIMYLAIALSMTCTGGRNFSVRLRDPRDSGHHPAFLIYPLLFLICNLPMALGPMILLANITPPLSFFMFCGGMIAANGFLDVVLWSTTMILLAPKDLSDAGLDQFAFVPTQRERQYGNMVLISGGNKDSKSDNDSGPGPWWRLRADSNPTMSQFHDSRGDVDRSQHKNHHHQNDQAAIQMDTVTSVVVESKDGSSGGNGTRPSTNGRVSYDTPSSSYSGRYL